MKNTKTEVIRLLKNEEKKWVVGVDYYPNNTVHHSAVFGSQMMRVYFTVYAVTKEQAVARATAIYEDEFGEESKPICQQAVEETDALTVFNGDSVVRAEYL